MSFTAWIGDDLKGGNGGVNVEAVLLLIIILSAVGITLVATHPVAILVTSTLTVGVALATLYRLINDRP